MDEIKTMIRHDRLRHRKKEVETTLRHLEKERREVEENCAWMNPDAYERRVSLLNRLTGWYRKEKQQIEKILGGVRASDYGLCCACNEPIEIDLLKMFPEAEFCRDCHEYQELLKAG